MPPEATQTQSGSVESTTTQEESSALTASAGAASEQDRRDQAVFDALSSGKKPTETSASSASDDDAGDFGKAGDETEQADKSKSNDNKSPASKAATEREAKKRRADEVQARTALDRAAGLLGWDSEDLKGLSTDQIIKLGTKAKAALDAKQREHDERTTRPSDQTGTRSEGRDSSADPEKRTGRNQADPEAPARVETAEGLDAVLDELDPETAKLLRSNLQEAKRSGLAEAETARNALQAARMELIESWGQDIRRELQADYPSLSDDDTVLKVVKTMTETFGHVDPLKLTRDDLAKRLKYAAYVELGESTRKDSARKQVSSAQSEVAGSPYHGSASKRGTDKTTMTQDDIDAAVLEALNGAPDLDTGRRRVSERLGTTRG